MKQSEIWLIDLDPTIGAEIQKKRPAIIVNDDKQDLLKKLATLISPRSMKLKKHYPKYWICNAK